jgi:hypothetical protein
VSRLAENKRDVLFAKLMNLNELKKDRILARTFGYFEHLEETNKTFEPERFFRIVEEFVGDK